jgi:hypothetical protein
VFWYPYPIPVSGTRPVFIPSNKNFSSRHAYLKTCNALDGKYSAMADIWKVRLSDKVKIFCWVFLKDRLHTCDNLFKKSILPDSMCPRCEDGVEDTLHTFVLCLDRRDLERNWHQHWHP